MKIPHAKFNEITARSIQIAIKNFFWIEKILKIGRVIAIIEGGLYDILTDQLVNPEKS